ncbi:MAG: glycosyltransferase family 4 protein [Actinomycetota bacterium]|nr:glycosyltransferase family 4 protein [Actinomycetota bacterium]
MITDATGDGRSVDPVRTLVIVVRADPIICGHATEARNLAEAALDLGVERVHIVTYPLDVLAQSSLPLKPIDRILPYSEGIVVDRPAPMGDYKVLDGRLSLAIGGRIIDILRTNPGPTIVMELYLVPHGQMVLDAVRALDTPAERLDVTTIGEAVGSDITNVVRNAVAEGRVGAAQMVLSTFLAHDVPVAVSVYTRELIAEAATEVDRILGTDYAGRVEREVGISYPAIDTAKFTTIDERPHEVDTVLERRGLERDGFVLFLSRVAPAKGVDDLVAAYRASALRRKIPLVICGTGPALGEIRELAAEDPDIRSFDDVDDDEKLALMHACTAYALPSKPRPEFTETFGIAVAEKMLAGGPGPVITTSTGGLPEATGGHCLLHDPGDVDGLRACLDEVAAMDRSARLAMSDAARTYARRFDRRAVLERLLALAHEGRATGVVSAAG